MLKDRPIQSSLVELSPLNELAGKLVCQLMIHIKCQALFAFFTKHQNLKIYLLQCLDFAQSNVMTYNFITLRKSVFHFHTCKFYDIFTVLCKSCLTSGKDFITKWSKVLFSSPV